MSSIRRHLPHLIVALSISLMMIGAFAAVGIVSAAQPRAEWKTNPVTITYDATSVSGSKADAFTCRPTLTGLTLTASGSTPRVRLQVAPPAIASCGSSPQSVILTATCLVPAQQCMGTYHVQVEIRQPAFYRDIPNTLRVTIHVTSCVNGHDECEHDPDLT